MILTVHSFQGAISSVYCWPFIMLINTLHAFYVEMYDSGVPGVLLGGSLTHISSAITDSVRYPSLPIAMSTPPNNERTQKWFKQKLRSVFSSRSPSHNLDVPDPLPSSTNVPPTKASLFAAQARENSPSDGPRITADRTVLGE